MLPLSSAWTPARALISVDFPAPFAPSSATISPRPTRRLTSSSARVAPNCFEAPRTSSRGGAAVTVVIAAVSASPPDVTHSPPPLLRAAPHREHQQVGLRKRTWRRPL